MSTKSSTSLSELRSLRGAVLAEEKAKTQAILANLPPNAFAPEAALIEEPIAPDFHGVVEEESPAALEPLPEPVAPESFPTAPTPKVAPAPPSREKPPAKSPALIVPLTPRIQQQLQRHIEESRWSASELVMELIRATLHQGYPAVQFESHLVAKGATYRTFERNPLEATLKIVSGQGVFMVTVKPESPEYQNWLSYFSGENAPNPELSASQICLFNLQNYLESLEDFSHKGWIKKIPSDQFSLEEAHPS